MPIFLSSTYSLKIPRAIWMMIALVACSMSVSAQYNPSFDSAYRAAENLSDGSNRLLLLKPLVNQSYEGNPFQTISFGNALLRAATEMNSDTDRYQAHIVLCTGYERSRDYGKAIDNGLMAADIARQRKDYVRQVRVLQLIAFTYSS